VRKPKYREQIWRAVWQRLKFNDMDFLILSIIGVLMGFFGGLLGIGGSVVMIPAMALVFGENQHLYQASAMICNFFVAASAVVAHKKTDFLMPDVVKLLVPCAAIAVILGVILSNLSFFAGRRSFVLARFFGAFMLYVVAYNCFRFFHSVKNSRNFNVTGVHQSVPRTIITGIATGISAGLLGIGGGSVCVPLQQLTLKMPLKNAISNSAATIILIAAVGACLKNATLGQHGIAVMDSVKIAAMIIPTAIVGGFLGARMMHILPKNIVRLAFILLLLIGSYKMLTAG